MDKEGRDIVNSISASARLEGKFAQAMENYVDNPDRTNAPTRKYCRVSDDVLENELTYENEQPNSVVLVEGTMVKGWDYMRGMPPGGTLVINTHYTPEYMGRFVPGAERSLRGAPHLSVFRTGGSMVAHSPVGVLSGRCPGTRGHLQ